MWAKVGVKAKLRTLPLVTYFPMIQRYEASIYMLGWGVPTFDALYSLQSLVRSLGTGGDGNYNVGRYSNARMDYIVDRVKTETDLPVRNRLLTEGLQLQNDTVANIPLHNQMLAWAMKKNVELVQRPDNRIDWRLIKLGAAQARVTAQGPPRREGGVSSPCVGAPPSRRRGRGAEGDSGGGHSTGWNMMIAMPASATSTPATSHGVGRMPSTAQSQ
eukprot:gene32949-55510_t